MAEMRHIRQVTQIFTDVAESNKTDSGRGCLVTEGPSA